MDKLLKNQRLLSVSIFGGLALLYLFWYYLIHYDLAKQHRMKTNAKEVFSAQVKKFSGMESQLISMEKEWEMMNDQFISVIEKIPDKRLYDSVTDFLYNMIANHGLKIQKFEPAGASLEKKTILIPETNNEITVEKIPVDINVKGSFINFGQLLESMLSSQYRLTVSDIGINKSSGSYSQTIKLISYIYVQSIKSRKQPANIVSSNQKINDKPITDAKVSEKEIKEAVKSIDENIKIADSLKDVPEMWLEPATEPIDQSAQIEISSSIEKDNNKKKPTRKKESKKKVDSKKESTASTIQKKEGQKTNTASNLTEFEDFYDITVIKSKTCEKVKNNLPINPKNRFLYDSGKVYCHSLLNNNSGKHMDIYHIWYMNGNLKAKVRIRVRAGKEIPAISHRSIEGADVGMWKVEITDSDKKILDTVIFEVV